MKPDLTTGLVLLSSQGVGIMTSAPEGLVSLAVGLIGVALARWVFVNKEQRRNGKKEEWYEWLPLTLTAMLIASVVIYDRGLSISASAFVGLGTGWAAVILLEVMGDRLTSMVRAATGASQPLPVPPPLDKLMDAIDHSGHQGRVLTEEHKLPEDMKIVLTKLDEKNQHEK